MKKIASHLRYLFLVLGAVLLVMLVRKIGLDTIIDNIRDIGWRFIPILSIAGFGYVFYTIAWMQFLTRLSDGISFFDLFRFATSRSNIPLASLTSVAYSPVRQ